MFTKKRVGLGVCAGVVALALVTAVGPWRAKVWAELGLSDVVHVEILDPGNLSITVFTPGGDVPDTLPIGVSSIVEPESLRGEFDIDDIDSVLTVLGGDLNADTGEITDELEEVEATLVNEFGDDREYLAVLDLANLEFDTLTRGEPVSLVAEDMIRTVAIIDGYYESRDVSDIVEGDAIEVSVLVGDAADIDTDGNGCPDATSLLNNANFVLFGANGTITIVRNLNPPSRGATDVVVDHFYESQFGPVTVTVQSPTLEALQLADSSFDAFNEARLIITIAEDSSDLIDEPSGASPLAEFDLVDGNDDPLPAPANLFVRAIIAVTDTARGSIPQWTFVGDLPGGLEMIGEFSGPGVAENLENGVDVDMYSYSITVTQDDEDIISESDDNSEWAEADEVQVTNENTADDEADSRDAVEADDGDDTVRGTFLLGSGIFGSNITPRAGGGGGGGGGGSGCFIATAAYGTPMAREIESLRGVRDSYLIDTTLGAAFVDAYYRISPSIAGIVSESPAAKAVVRAALAPVVAVSGWTMAAPGAAASAGIALAALVVLGLARRMRGARTR